MKSTSRAKYQCPPLLEEIINLLKFLPIDIRRDFPQNISVEKDIEFLNYVESLHPKIKEYLFRFDLPDLISIAKTEEEKRAEEDSQIWHKCRATFARYEDLMSAKTLFIQITERNKVASEIKKQYGFEVLGIHVFDEDRKNTAGLYADNNGFLKPFKSVFFAIFETEDVEYRRIRQCLICEHIFWAKRKDSETCSKNCFNALRQRRHRERNKEAINVKRRENYNYKKKITKTDYL